MLELMMGFYPAELVAWYYACVTCLITPSWWMEQKAIEYGLPSD